MARHGGSAIEAAVARYCYDYDSGAEPETCPQSIATAAGGFVGAFLLGGFFLANG